MTISAHGKIANTSQMHLQHARDCNACPSPHAHLAPAPLVRRSHVQCITGPDRYWLACCDSLPQRPVKQASGRSTRHSNFKYL